MTAWVIVAIPSEDDYVWNLSSEKIPHMTLLFLGEPDDRVSAERIALFTQHVANTSLSRFGLSVDRRGTLGPDDADVLFFEKDFAKQIEDVRSQLLTNDDINMAYNAVEQYPEWTPHLTLGYPTAPAKKDKRDYPGTHWVNFDRIALWTGDFEGIEFPLRRQDDRALAMTDKVDEFLAHHGVKGMKWGVRKSTSSGGSSSSESTSPKGRKSTEAEGVPKGSRASDGRIKKGEAGKIIRPAQKHSLSDEELRQAINRINMERQYAQLTHKPGKGDAAKKFVTDMLVDIGKQQAKTILTSVATKQVNKQLEKAGMPVGKGKKKK